MLHDFLAFSIDIEKYKDVLFSGSFACDPFFPLWKLVISPLSSQDYKISQCVLVGVCFHPLCWILSGLISFSFWEIS